MMSHLAQVCWVTDSEIGESSRSLRGGDGDGPGDGLGVDLASRCGRQKYDGSPVEQYQPKEQRNRPSIPKFSTSMHFSPSPVPKSCSLSNKLRMALWITRMRQRVWKTGMVVLAQRVIVADLKLAP